MHTFKLKKYLWRAHHNGDFSGDVILRNDETGAEFRVPAGFLLALVGKCIEGRIIETLEQTDFVDGDW
jgi:hypothetical protein